MVLRKNGMNGIALLKKALQDEGFSDMRVRENLPIKSHSTAPYIYGRYYSSIYMTIKTEEQKRIRAMLLRKERSVRIRKLITFFHQIFENSPEILSATDELFRVWEKQKFNKEIPQAMIQIENTMREHGFVEEYKLWKASVSDKFLKE